MAVHSLKPSQKRLTGAHIIRKIGPTTTRGGAALAYLIGIKRVVSGLFQSPTALTPRFACLTPTYQGAFHICFTSGVVHGYPLLQPIDRISTPAPIPRCCGHGRMGAGAIMTSFAERDSFRPRLASLTLGLGPIHIKRWAGRAGLSLKGYMTQ